MIVKEKYRGLTRPQLLEKVYQLGVGYESNSYGCSQCVVAALHEVVGFDDVIVKVTTTCAGIMTQKFGRPFYLNDPDEFWKLEEAGAHTDPKKYMDVIGQAASLVMEILLDKGAVELSA
jgi:hypothetical protein